MKPLVLLISVLFSGGILLCAGLGESSAAESRSGTQTLRLYATVGGEKRYFTGYDWLQFNIHQQFQIVEKARHGAVRMNAIMVLPAEVYVKELNRMFRQHVELRHMELGQAIQGIAIALKDWDDGSNQEERIKSYLKTPDSAI